jgi:putative ABC transport system permease protein
MTIVPLDVDGRADCFDGKTRMRAAALLPPRREMISLLAWRNLRRSPRRFLATVIGLAFAVLLVVVQIGLLQGFIDASERVVTRSGADLVVAPRGVRALEYPSALDVRLGDRLLAVPGVRDYIEVSTGFIEYHRGSVRTGVTLIGASKSTAFTIPSPHLTAASSRTWAEPFIVDLSSSSALGLEQPGEDAEIHGRRGVLSEWTDQYASYLGSPYLFVSIDFARSIMGIRPEQAHFLFLKLDPGVDVERVRETAQSRLSGEAVMTAVEFASITSDFWLFRTGAGVALLVSACLGLIVGIVLVAQNLYAGTVERMREYATLRAIGLSRRDVSGVVLMEAVICGLLGATSGAMMSIPAIGVLRHFQTPWIATPLWAVQMMAIVGVLTAVGAGIVAVRRALTSDPLALLRGA